MRSEATLLAFADHRRVSNALSADGGDCETVPDLFAGAGILAGQLRQEGAEVFVKSWKDLMLCIETKSHATLAGVATSFAQVCNAHE